jgi:hypothetical protein
VDHLTLPLEALRARLCWFVLASDARLLHVPIDPELLEPARDIAAGLEWLPANRAPFLVLGHAGELATVYEARREAYRQSGIELPAIVTAPFAAELAAIARAFTEAPAGTRGLMVVLAPDTPDASRVLPAPEIAALAVARGLENIRWIWLDASAASGVTANARALAVVGPRLVTAPCHIDRAAQKREAGELLAAIIATVEQRSPSVPGGARPAAAPPRHPGDPAGDAAAPPPYLLPLLRGIEALRAGGAQAALPWLRRACDAAATAAGSPRDAADMEILLAAVSVQVALAEARPVLPALALFGSATTRADAAGLSDVAAKAQLLLGVSARAASLNDIAARAFTTAAARAESAGDETLQSHALRLGAEGAR